MSLHLLPQAQSRESILKIGEAFNLKTYIQFTYIFQEGYLHKSSQTTPLLEITSRNCKAYFAFKSPHLLREHLLGLGI